MKAITATVVVVSMVSLPITGRAQQSSSTGLTGLGEMRTPGTIQENGGEITLLPARFSILEAGPSQKSFSRTALSIGYTQGFGSRFEAGFQIPYLMHEAKQEDGFSDGGLGNIPVAAKYRFFDGTDFQMAVDAGLELPTASTKKGEEYGTGELGFGAGLLGSVFAGPVELAASAGYSNTDYCLRCTTSGTQLPEPRLIPKVRGAVGASYVANSGFGGFAEVHASKANNGVIGDEYSGDPDLFALAGVRVPVFKRFTVTGYGGAGLAEGANTRALGALMLHYDFGAVSRGPRSKRMAKADTSPEPVAIAVATPAPTPTPKPVATVARPIATPTPTPAPTPQLAVATPAPTPTPVPEPTPAAPLVKLTAPQTMLLQKLQVGEPFALETVTFKGITTELAPAATAQLTNLAAVMKAHPEVKVRVEAHVDPTDPDPVTLSGKRAEAIVSKLTAMGVPASAIEAKGMGGSKSLFPSFVEAMKAKNRRVEAIVVSPAVMATGASTAPAVSAARVKVLASKGTNAAAVKLANQLKRVGSKVTTVAAVPEQRKATLVYFTADHKAEAERLANGLEVPGGVKTQAAKTLGANIDIVIVVGSDLK